ncbi:MAG: MAPEG family protein [Hyphomonadaceae bacterium]|nr:MAPEG family protein [Hyphomonadaceae bacterium]
MQQFTWTALVTLIALIVYFIMAAAVGRARVKYNVPAPATAGDPVFERYFRVHMNTLEWLPIFLPSLWLFAAYRGDQLAAAIGGVWIVGRLLYMALYVRDPKLRSAGFGLQALAALWLLVGALVSVVQSLVAASAL